jgi:hypothetical protein
MNKTYKVVKEEGVVFDEVEIAFGDLMSIDPEIQDVSALIADGSIEEVIEEGAEDVTPEVE